MRQPRIHNRMKPYKKILIWFGSILISLMVTGYLLMDFAVDYVLDSMANQAIESAMKTSLNNEKQVSKGNSSGNVIDGDHEGQDNLINTGEGSSNARLDGQASSKDAQATSEPAISYSSDAKADPLTYSAEIPTDKANIVKEGITIKEKAAVASVILTKFSASDLKLFADLANGGLTIEEKKAAKIKFLDTLSEEEYDGLIVIAAKYGLSQGDKYSETGRP